MVSGLLHVARENVLKVWLIRRIIKGHVGPNRFHAQFSKSIQCAYRSLCRCPAPQSQRHETNDHGERDKYQNNASEV